MEKNFKLSDCTSRDGGDYNNWFFDKKLVEETLAVPATLPVDFYEVGFQKYSDDQMLGDNLYTTQDYLNTLATLSNLRLALMCMLRNFDGLSDTPIQKVFVPKKDSKIEFICIAVSLSKLDKSIRIGNLVKDLGYQVSLNTHISTFSKEHIQKELKQLQGKEFSVICFADTIGNIFTQDIDELVNMTRIYYPGDIGCHIHDNCGFTMETSLFSLRKGMTWVDATITERCTVNLILESILIEMNLDLRSLFELNEKSLTPIEKIVAIKQGIRFQ